MLFLSFLKPDADKWVLSFLLFSMYWIIYLVTGWTTDYLHAQAYPLLSQPLPSNISFANDSAAVFEEFWREVERSKIPFIALKLIISFIGCYLTACLLAFIINKPDTNS